MLDMNLLMEACEATQALLPPVKPPCVLVLGSGWSKVVEGLPARATVDYADIPCLGATSVEGHDSRLCILSAQGMDIAVFHGRRHWYEGAGWEPIVFPVVFAKHLGASVLLLTNAAGGIREDLSPGSLMVIDDHINAMPSNPLQGPHQPALGPRFPDQTEVYDSALGRLLDRAGKAAGTQPPHGVYIAVPGPAYETPAEIAAYRRMGADAVGMSTVPEAMVANATGLRVAALSCITNSAAGIADSALTHREVIGTTRQAQPHMKALLGEFFRLLGDTDDITTCQDTIKSSLA